MALFTKKKVTCDLIEAFLDQRGWAGHVAVDEPSEKEGVVITGWRSIDGTRTYKLAIDPIVEKSLLIFRAHEILKAPPNSTPAANLNGLLMAMAAINYRTGIGAWALDPADGEVVYKAALPIDSDQLAFEDFDHCVNAVSMTVEEYGPKLRAIATGETTVADLFEERGFVVG